MLTGVWYYAGYSELPAMAVLPLVAWLWLRGKSVRSPELCLACWPSNAPTMPSSSPRS